MSDYTSGLVDLVNALSDWKDAGGDPLKVVGAIQRFIHVVCDEREAARLQAELVEARKA